MQLTWKINFEFDNGDVMKCTSVYQVDLPSWIYNTNNKTLK